MLSTTVTLFLGLLANLPQEVTAVANAYATVKSALDAKDVATLDPIFAAINAKTDTDVAQFDADASKTVA